MIRLLSLILLLLLPLSPVASDRVVNLYAWSGYIPDSVIRQFERETGIKVNISTFENNEVMYAKIHASKNDGYDVITPSGYFVDRMRKEDLLEQLDQTALTQSKHLNPQFIHLPFDPKGEYSIPFLWGTSGIFVNDNYVKPKSITKWQQLWDKRFADQLLLLDDNRDIFAMALLTLGYSINDRKPEHIKQAFDKLKMLMKNVKVFSSDTVVSIMIDEDATVGMAWNGDAYKAYTENNAINYIYPLEGFVIWIDNLAIPKNPPHKQEAHELINFLMRPEIAKEIALYTGYPTANLAAQKKLPPSIRDNPAVYPPKEILQRGQYQVDVGNDTLALYEKYWEQLKMMT